MPTKNESHTFPRAKGVSMLEVLGYTYPRLHETKQWFIDFQTIDPITGAKRRKKFNVPSLPTVTARREHAQHMIFDLVSKLIQGWSPWTGGGNTTKSIPWEQICTDYLDNINRQYKSKSIKLSSVQNYTSYLKALKRYINIKYSIFAFAHQLTRNVINDFLNYLITEMDVSARTRNNYQVWLFAFCSFLCEKGVYENNPAEGIKKMKESDKFRKQLTRDDLKLLRNHLQKTDKRFLLACLFEYYTFIRPEELCSVKIGDISVKAQKISLHGAFTKNGKDAAVGLNQELVLLMVELDVFSHPSEDYLFGSRNFEPSPRKQSGRIFRERFQRLRKELSFPAHYQFYSLKDTGIRDLANAEGIVIARDQARHSDISTTNKYLKEDACAVHDETKHFKGSF